MIVTLRNIALCCLLYTVCSAEHRNEPLTVREVLFQLCDSTMKELSETGLRQYRSVGVRFNNDTFSTAFRQQIIAGLSLQNIPLYLNSDSTETILELTVRESSVFFGDVFTEGFLGNRKTSRTIQFSVMGSLVTGTEKKVLWTKPYAATFCDTVDYAAVKNIDHASIPLTAYTEPRLSFFDSVLEPAIITIASGVAIYLFFTIRS